MTKKVNMLKVTPNLILSWYSIPVVAFSNHSQLRFVAGTIDRTRIATFERVLWRVLRGNLYMNQTDITEPAPRLAPSSIWLLCHFAAESVSSLDIIRS